MTVLKNGPMRKSMLIRWMKRYDWCNSLMIEYAALGKTLPENKVAASDSEYHLSALVIDNHLQQHGVGKGSWSPVVR